MSRKSTFVLVSCCILFGVPSFAEEKVYAIRQYSGLNVGDYELRYGTITTDGSTGLLGDSFLEESILDWEIHLGTPNGDAVLRKSNSNFGGGENYIRVDQDRIVLMPREEVGGLLAACIGFSPHPRADSDVGFALRYCNTTSFFIGGELRVRNPYVSIHANSDIDINTTVVLPAFTETEIGIERIEGDLFSDESIDVRDIDLLSTGIRNGNLHSRFDLNGDGQNDRMDREFWVYQIKDTYFGDSNLDGEFDSSDLIKVFQAGRYEDGVSTDASWMDGDWDGDGDVDTNDLIVAFAEAGYERGPRAIQVPEPCTAWMVAVSLFFFARLGFVGQYLVRKESKNNIGDESHVGTASTMQW